MLRTRNTVFAAAVALTAGLTLAAPLAEAGASTGKWRDGSVAVDGRVYSPRPTYRYGGYGYRRTYGDDDGYRGYYDRPGYYRDRGYYGDRGYYRERRSDAGAAAAAGIIGLTTGAIIGGALSQQNRGTVSCTRFRSYNPATGTYVGRDGRRHYC